MPESKARQVKPHTSVEQHADELHTQKYSCSDATQCATY